MAKGRNNNNEVKPGCAYGALVDERIQNLERLFLLEKEDQNSRWNHQQDVNKQLFERLREMGDLFHNLEKLIEKKLGKMDKAINYILILLVILVLSSSPIYEVILFVLGKLF